MDTRSPPACVCYWWLRRPPSSTRFPYTTLFRSETRTRASHGHDVSMAVSAGAGSGKTSVLVARVESALSSGVVEPSGLAAVDRKSTRLNSSHSQISYAVFCLEQKNTVLAHLSVA